jgi:PIN domain nuclease of toxin-antitoxin system
MTEAVLLDTHVWAWSMLRDPRLSEVAGEVLNGDTPIMISPISAFEIGQKVRLGKWPEMKPFAGKLESYVEWQDATIAPVTLEIADFAARLAWDHRDPFDRLLAATATVNGWRFLTADSAFSTLSSLRRIW